jgi:hypothetical protein
MFRLVDLNSTAASAEGYHENADDAHKYISLDTVHFVACSSDLNSIGTACCDVTVASQDQDLRPNMLIHWLTSLQ